MSDNSLERTLIKRTVDGLAGWLLYHQSCATGQYYSEHILYEPIANIARGRQWKIVRQQKISSTGKRGAPSTIDFVFYRTPGNYKSRAAVIFVEVKYIRAHDISQDINYVLSDIDKLNGKGIADLKNNKTLLKCGNPQKFIIFAWQFQAMRILSSYNPQAARHRNVVNLLIDAGSQNPSKGIHWSEPRCYLKRDLKWRVMAIPSYMWPK